MKLERLTTLLDEFLKVIAEFDLTAYEGAVQHHGRTGLAADSAIVQQIESLATAVTKMLEEDRLAAGKDLFDDFAGSSSDDPKEIDCLCDGHSNVKLRRVTAETMAYFLVSQRQTLRDRNRLYENYASIPLLRHLLRVDRSIPLNHKQAQIWVVFQQVLSAQMAFEGMALSEALPYETREFSPEVALQRLERLAELQRAVPADFRIAAPQHAPTHAAELRSIIEEHGEAEVIRRLLVFPQTTYHDEVAFIRLIQLAECLFWGALLHVRDALQAINVNHLDVAVLRIRQASDFASPLIMVFRAVRTMPPAHFLSFRHTTDHASAIQSLSWQLLDAHMYGVLPEKKDILSGIKMARKDIDELMRPGFRPLVAAASGLGNSDEALELQVATVELDHGLRAWRKFHEKQLAGRSNPSYLPAGALGTGGTSGYQYLAAQKPPRMKLMRTPMQTGSIEFAHT